MELARFARLGLHCAVLVVMALLLNTTPGLGVRNCVESEAPVDTDYLESEAALSPSPRLRVRQQPRLSVIAHAHELQRLAAQPRSARTSGRRLHNSLLTPLRC